MEILKSYRNTVVVNTIFVVIYLAMIIAGINELWIWSVFTIAWIAAEWKFAGDSPLKTWHWAAIIVGLVVLGMAVEIAIA